MGVNVTSTVDNFEADPPAPRPAGTKWRHVVALVSFALLLGSALSAGPANALPPNPFTAPTQRVLDRGDQVPDTGLVDQSGATRSLRDYRGDALVIGFVYTSCKDECPLVTAKFAILAARLPQSNFHLIEVSVDPARDTPRVLAAYARAHHIDASKWTLLTGPLETVVGFERAFGVSAIDNGHGTILHNDRTVIVDERGAIADIIDEAGWTPDDVVADARSAAGLSANPFDRLDLALGRAVAYACGGVVNGRTGLTDLVAVVAIFGLSVWAMVWVSRRIFGPGT